MNRVVFYNILVLFCFSSCSDQRTASILDKKIGYYYDFYKENDEDLVIELNRLSRNKKAIKEYHITRLTDNSVFAVMQTYPDIFFQINFEKNPLNTDFITTFSRIDCLTLIRKGDNVYIENKIRDSIYILFKGDILRDEDLADQTTVKHLRDNWYYFSYLFDPDVERKRNRYRAAH